MQITVASIDTKAKHSFIITSENRRLRCWNDKVAKFGLEEGASYEVETEDSDYNGTKLTYIVKAKRIAGVASVLAPLMSQAHREPAPRPATCQTDAERMFVCSILKSLIEAGEVKNDKTQLWTTTQMLRGLWRHTFGFEAVDKHMQAAE